MATIFSTVLPFVVVGFVILFGLVLIIMRQKYRRQHASMICCQISKCLYAAQNSGGDRLALNLFHQADDLIRCYGLTRKECGLVGEDRLAHLAYDAFCMYIKLWKLQHQTLQNNVWRLRSSDVSVVEYLSEVARLGFALHNSCRELDSLESSARSFYNYWLKPEIVEFGADVQAAEPITT